MNNDLKPVLLFVILCSFQVKGQDLKTVKYQGLETRSEQKRPKNICVYMDIPSGFVTSKFNGLHFGENGVSFTYLDGSELFISNAFYDGTSLNIKNRNYSHKPRIADIDSLSSFGTQENNLLWREVIAGKVVVGYLNVPSEKKELFDKALGTLRHRKRKK